MTMRAWALSAALLSLGACAADDDDGPSPCGSKPCARDCDALAGPRCDVLDRSCRERIFDTVVCVRGTPGVMPQTQTITEDEYRAELFEEADASSGDASAIDPDDDAGVAADAQSEDVWSRALQLLGLIAPTSDVRMAALDSSSKNIAGYYDAERDSITLIDRGDPQDSYGAAFSLAHELVHALQDQEVGLSELSDRTAGSTDSAFARGCMVEGEANLYARLAMALYEGLDADLVYLDRVLDGTLKYAKRSVVTSPSPFAEIWTLRYPVGERYVFDAWREGGSAAVHALYWALPSSSVQWLHPYAEGRGPSELLALALPCLNAAAPVDFEQHSYARMGAAVVFAFLGRALRDGQLFASEELWRVAGRWRQDSLTVFRGPAEQLAVSWRIRFDDAALAEQLAGELTAASQGALRVRARGTEIEVLASDDAEVLDAWEGTDPDACPILDD